MPAEAMLARLADYRRGNRPGTVMPQIVKGYTEEQLRLVAAYFAAQAKP
jgi:cytochrome c553